jgi:hypothetical protein
VKRCAAELLSLSAAAFHRFTRWAAEDDRTPRSLCQTEHLTIFVIQSDHRSTKAGVAAPVWVRLSFDRSVFSGLPALCSLATMQLFTQAPMTHQQQFVSRALRASRRRRIGTIARPTASLRRQARVTVHPPLPAGLLEAHRPTHQRLLSLPPAQFSLTSHDTTGPPQDALSFSIVALTSRHSSAPHQPSDRQSPHEPRRAPPPLHQPFGPRAPPISDSSPATKRRAAGIVHAPTPGTSGDGGGPGHGGAG